MEKENVQKLGALYRKAKAASNPAALAMLDSAMNQLLAAEAAITSMMVAESLAIETLEAGSPPGVSKRTK